MSARALDRLAPKEELELVLAAQGGDAAATEKLVAAFLPMIGGVARCYRNSPVVERDELMQEGVVGLLRALKRYDPGMGTPFWAYASWWVRQAMQQLVSEVARPVVLSDRAHRRLARIKDARREHLQEVGTDPSTTALAEATGFSRRQVDDLLTVERPSRGLEEPVGGEDAGSTVGELLSDPVAEEDYVRVIESIEIDEIRHLSAHLTDRERNIVSAHYGLGHPAQTLREIAAVFGLSVERVRQIEECALGKLRTAATAAAIPNRSTSSRAAGPPLTLGVEAHRHS